MSDGDKVYIVLEGPETYYGDAEIHGVYSTPEEAEARVRQLWPGLSKIDRDEDIVEWEIGTPRAEGAST